MKSRTVKDCKRGGYRLASTNHGCLPSTCNRILTGHRDSVRTLFESCRSAANSLLVRSGHRGKTCTVTRVQAGARRNISLREQAARFCGLWRRSQARRHRDGSGRQRDKLREIWSAPFAAASTVERRLRDLRRFVAKILRGALSGSIRTRRVTEAGCISSG